MNIDIVKVLGFYIQIWQIICFKHDTKMCRIQEFCAKFSQNVSGLPK